MSNRSTGPQPRRYAWFVGGAGQLIDIVARDAQLRAWVLELEHRTPSQRIVELEFAVARMRAVGEDVRLVAIVESMKHEPMFNGVMRTLKSA